ncbi:hypothetical protein [Cryobacterium sp. CG_9.6]|nr:hypothetical protein [Cryobacterium sp. CG_9.6]MDH6235282.1 hypothetical protein [Cryobacterium sp. CG_9.6]
MFALLILLAVISLSSIVALVGIVARDGYHRVPERALVRIF